MRLKNHFEKILLFSIGSHKMELLYAGTQLLKEKISLIEPKWFKGFRQYYDIKMTLPEFHVLYTLYRIQYQTAWSLKLRDTEQAIRSFYKEDTTKFHLFRAVYRHRLSSFYDILRYAKSNDNICEYGCGIAPVTNFLVSRLRKAKFTCVDIDSHMFDYVKWRLNHWNVEFLSPGLENDYPLKQKYDIITCLDVLEHVPNPLTLCNHFYDHLNVRGKLFVNFIYAPTGENLESSARLRDATIDFLNRNFKPIRALNKEDKSGQDGLYVKV